MEDPGTVLAKLCDQLNEEITLVERFMAAAEYGTAASVPLPGGNYVTFGKREGQWRLLYETPSSVDPLVNKSRQIRLEAVPLLQGLFDVLRMNAEAEAVNVKSAINELRALRGAL